jgi:hypothetical protein
LTQNAIPEHGRSATEPPSAPMGGEIVGIEEGRIRVRLETGVTGFLATSAGEEPLLQVGQHGTFCVVRNDENGDPVLGLVEVKGEQTPHSFEHDVNRLQDALNHHHAAPIAREDAAVTMDEQSIQNWLGRVDKSLDKLRRNRSKRLNEEFYTGS